MIEMDLHTISANTGVKDENNALWYITDIDGWDGPSLNTTSVNADTRDGGFVANIQLNPRTITLTGVCKITSGIEQDFWASRDKLLGVLTSFGATRLFKVMEYPSPKQVSWYPMGDPKIQIHAGWFDWSVQFICPDPRKYSVNQISITVTPGSGATVNTTLVNLGNYATPFYMDINGTPDASYRYPYFKCTQVINSTTMGTLSTAYDNDATYPTSWYAYDGNAYTISSYDRSFIATADGVSYYSTFMQTGVNALKWFDVQPGVQTITNYIDTNTPGTGINFTLRFRSAWL